MASGSNSKLYDKVDTHLTTREHDPCSPAYSFLRKEKAQACLKNNEQKLAAYNLSESLGVSFRTNATYISDTKCNDTAEPHLFDKAVLEMNFDIKSTDPMRAFFFGKAREIQSNMREAAKKRVKKVETKGLQKSHLNHISTDVEGMGSMMDHLKDLPKEWTVVQLTKANSMKKFYEPLQDSFKDFTGIFITIFQCEAMTQLKIIDPVTTILNPPHEDSGVTNLFAQYHPFIDDISQFYTTGLNTNRAQHWKTLGKHNIKLKGFVDELESWLGGWKSLLLGTLLTDRKSLSIKHAEIDDIIKEHDIVEIDPGQKLFLYRLAEISPSLPIIDIQQMLSAVLPTQAYKPLRVALCKAMKYSFAIKSINLKKCKRGPVILIVDEMLDILPWEMLSIFYSQPVSRSVSLNLIFALYEKHKKYIQDGYYLCDNSSGRYILNAADKLPDMQKRITSFLQYWLPHWIGKVGLEVTRTSFKDTLAECSSIFMYNGHGSGMQHIPVESVEMQNLQCVVFLCGCSSVATKKPSMKIEGDGAHMSYHIACSPCVVGNLWPVTDRDMDYVMATTLSTWLPATDQSKIHFRDTNVETWKKQYKISTTKSTKKVAPEALIQFMPSYDDLRHEPDLLKAIACCKGVAKSYLNSCALVARGIPVKYVEHRN